MPSPEKLLTFRVTQRYADDKAEGHITLSDETHERPYPVTREQAETCAEECGAKFEEQTADEGGHS